MIDVLIVLGGLWLAAFGICAVLFAVAFFFGAPISAYRHKRREERTARTMAAFEGCGITVVPGRVPHVPVARITRLDPATPPAATVPTQRHPRINGAPR